MIKYFNINTISDVNASCIHFNDNGNQWTYSTKSNFKALQVARDEITVEMAHIEYMIDFTSKQCKEIENRRDTVKSAIESCERYISENQHLPIVRRGLHDVFSTLKEQEQKYSMLSNKLSGLHELKYNADDKKRKLQKIVNSINAIERVRDFEKL